VPSSPADDRGGAQIRLRQAASRHQAQADTGRAGTVQAGKDDSPLDDPAHSVCHFDWAVPQVVPAASAQASLPEASPERADLGHKKRG